MEETNSSCSHGKYSRSAKRLKLGEIVNSDVISSQQSLIEQPPVAINILPFLDVWNVLSFGSCSKSLRGICESEETWCQLFKQRWSNRCRVGKSPLGDQGWKGFYMGLHMTSFVGMSKLLGTFQKEMGFMLDAKSLFLGVNSVRGLNLTYEDVYFYFFRKGLNVVIILIGIYYAFFCWDVSVDDLKKDLVARRVAEKKMRIRWCLPVSDHYGFYMPEEKYTRVLSLEEFIETKMSFFYFFRCTIKDRELHIINKEVKDVLIEPA